MIPNPQVVTTSSTQSRHPATIRAKILKINTSPKKTSRKQAVSGEMLRAEMILPTSCVKMDGIQGHRTLLQSLVLSNVESSQFQRINVHLLACLRLAPW